MRTKRILIAAAALLIMAGGVWFAWRRLASPTLPQGILEGHGRVEGTEVTVSSKVTGRIVDLPVTEGDLLEKGALIAVLSAGEIEARLAQARSQAKAAEQQALLPEEESRAQLSETNARLAAAEKRLEQVIARIEVLEHHARKARIDYQRYQALFREGAISAQQLDIAENAVALSEGEFREARALLVASRAEIDAIRAMRDGIVRKIPLLLEAAQAQAAAARALRDEAQAAVSDTRITSPLAGTVVTKAAEEGELVFPGRTLVVLVDLTRPYLRVYLPERDIGKVKLGDSARVYVDSFPERPFDATVTEVAKKAEFTPKDVHMPDERVTLVYSVKLEIRSPQGQLKPGMPADALIRWKPDAPWR